MSESRIDDILSQLQERFNMSDVKISREEFEQMQVDAFNSSTGDINQYDGYDCPLCKNKGFIARLENGYQVVADCKCRKIRATLRRAMKSGLGDVLSECTFDKYIATEKWQQDIKSKAQAFCKDDNAKWFFIGGQSGAGKSHLCTAIVGHYIKAGSDAQYMLWLDESTKLKGLKTDGAEYQRIIALYKETPVLYIDDLFKSQAGEVPTGADIKLAFELINFRLLDKNKITVISSELTWDDLLKYDEATMSRIYQQTGDYKSIIGRDIKKNYRLRG